MSGFASSKVLFHNVPCVLLCYAENDASNGRQRSGGNRRGAQIPDGILFRIGFLSGHFFKNFTGLCGPGANSFLVTDPPIHAPVWVRGRRAAVSVGPVRGSCHPYQGPQGINQNTGRGRFGGTQSLLRQIWEEKLTKFYPPCKLFEKILLFFPIGVCQISP